MMTNSELDRRDALLTALDNLERCIVATVKCDENRQSSVLWQGTYDGEVWWVQEFYSPRSRETWYRAHKGAPNGPFPSLDDL